MSDLLLNTDAGREPLQASFSDAANPLGLDGIEFIEFATTKPQALGQVLEMMGFRPVARHRSREVLLYRQGELNIVVNAHPSDAQGAGHGSDVPSISAMALRVRDARAAYHYVIERGAWSVPTHAEVMELNIPAMHGAGGSRIYFVDRYKEFSIYDVDFVPIPTVDQRPPATAGIHFFGIVQYIGPERSNDWIAFYDELFGTELIPDDQRFGIMPKGHAAAHPGAGPGQALHAAAGRAAAERARRRREAAAHRPGCARCAGRREGLARTGVWSSSRPRPPTPNSVARSPRPTWARWCSSWCTASAPEAEP